MTVLLAVRSTTQIQGAGSVAPGQAGLVADFCDRKKWLRPVGRERRRFPHVGTRLLLLQSLTFPGGGETSPIRKNTDMAEVTETMDDLPPVNQLAMAAFVVGILFLLRYYLALRRIRREVRRPQGFKAADDASATARGTDGEDLGPGRRYALRQLVVACLLLGAAILLVGWMLAAGIPLLPQGPSR